ncbi:MAG TPA: DUF3103 family protein [Micromonosporaceae bacterium]|nr:DUF3103 family protein [Micromonosporaceae bacterium]
MYPRAFRRTALSLSAAAAILIASVATPAHARPDQSSTGAVSAAPAGSVAAVTDSLARQLAGLLDNAAIAERVIPAVTAGPVDLAQLDLTAGFTRTVQTANRSVLAAKGLPATADSLLQLRLAHPDMRAALERGELPLVAAPPTDDDSTSVTAYDRNRTPVLLDAVRLPQRPVLVVEVDVAKAMPLGLQVVRDALAASGVRGARPADSGMVTAAGGYWATKITAVRLADDKEPWVKGAAEIFSIVGGFGHDGKVAINIVDMPYLDHDNTTYYPNQILVHYSAYKYNLADVVMMEDDGDTNYQQLAQALVSALLFIVDGGAYAPLVSAILGALPTSWWTDDPDYVDSWYTLSTSSSGRRYGAANNGWMDVVPYWVQAF